MALTIDPIIYEYNQTPMEKLIKEMKRAFNNKFGEDDNELYLRETNDELTPWIDKEMIRFISDQITKSYEAGRGDKGKHFSNGEIIKLIDDARKETRQKLLEKIEKMKKNEELNIDFGDKAFEEQQYAKDYNQALEDIKKLLK